MKLSKKKTLVFFAVAIVFLVICLLIVIKPTPQPSESGKNNGSNTELVINGKTYYGTAIHSVSSFTAKTINCYFSGYKEISSFHIDIPYICNAEDVFIANYSENQDNIEFVCYDRNSKKEGYLIGTYHPGNFDRGTTGYYTWEQSRFNDKNDYFRIRIISDDAQECQFQFDGRFDSGQTIVSGTCRFKKKTGFP